MGRKGSNLVLFFQEGLKDNKYMNLKHSSAARNAFSLNLPRKSRKLKAEHQHLFKDWYARKGRLYKDFEDYTQAKGGMEAALRRSMFFERVESPEKSERDKLIYRILDDREVKEKKNMKAYYMKDFTISSVESGYGSLFDSSGDCIEDSDSEHDLVVESTVSSSHLLEVCQDTCAATACSKFKVMSLSYENASDNFCSEKISNGKNGLAYSMRDCPFSLLEQMECLNQVSKVSEESQISEISFTDEDLDYINELIQQESYCPDSYQENNITKDLIEKSWSEDLEKMYLYLDNLKALPDLNQDIEMVQDNGAEEITEFKVYELMKTVGLDDVVQLVFKSKWKKISSSVEHHDSNPFLIIDEETFKMMSSNYYIETKFLDDYLLVFLKPY